MKRLLLLLMFLVTFKNQAQKNYHFDHLLEYDYRSHQDSVPEIRFILTKASDNNYNAVIAEDEDLQYKIDFTDQDGLQFLTRLPKNEFIAAGTINIPCKMVFPFKNKYKKRVKDHAFYSLADSLVDGQNLQRFELRHVDENYLKRKKFARNYYVLANDSDHHKPTFLHPTAYEEWKKERTLPNGIFKARYQLNHKQDTVGIYELKAAHRINLSFVIEKGCDTRS